MLKKIKMRILNFKNAIQYEKDAINHIKIAVTNIQNSLKEINKLMDDLQKQISKLNFKNKPHLERIDEAQTRITETLAAFSKKKDK